VIYISPSGDAMREYLFTDHERAVVKAFLNRRSRHPDLYQIMTRLRKAWKLKQDIELLMHLIKRMTDEGKDVGVWKKCVPRKMLSLEMS